MLVNFGVLKLHRVQNKENSEVKISAGRRSGEAAQHDYVLTKCRHTYNS